LTLTAKDVAEIARLLEDSSFDELSLELDGLKLTLRRGGAAAATAPAREAPAHEPPEPPAPAAPAARPTSGAAPDGATQDVTAPLLGTFYRAPKPGASPFVEVGSTVEEETIIGIIEVMKLMNTVRAGTRGRVVQIPAQDGALVEYGETLMRVSQAAPV
jgi:acetyl-CoA carboxylase biotin carboxyl carrier protein